MLRPRSKSAWERFYRVIRRVPRGKVTTYGAIAALAGQPGAARQVGYALAALRSATARNVPWQRVLGKRGARFAAISLDPFDGGAEQRALLQAEGVRFDLGDRISLERFGWPSLSPGRAPAPRGSGRAPRPPASRSR
jgi:methylated-DNA-protein-cysteine methyltransferase-like protein